MPPIFEARPQQIGGAFTAENLWLDLGKGDATGAIIQRVNFTINRPINFVYEIGSAPAAPGTGNNVYYVGGRRQGQATFERIVGGSNLFKDFLLNYGPLCQPAGVAAAGDISLKANGGCNIVPGNGQPAKGVVYRLKTPRLTTVGASVAAQEIVIMENLSLMFLDLAVDDA